jgi:hypothetical protein
MTSFAFILGVLPLVIAQGAGGRIGSGLGYSGLCWNDRRDLFWNLSHPGIFLSDHEDFCSGAQQEAGKLYLALSTRAEPVPSSQKDLRHRSQSVEKAHFWRNLLSFR